MKCVSVRRHLRLAYRPASRRSGNEAQSCTFLFSMLAVVVFPYFSFFVFGFDVRVRVRDCMYIRVAFWNLDEGWLCCF